MHEENKKKVQKKEQKTIDSAKFESLANEAKSLEKEINAIIKNFEKKYQLDCWISLKKRNQIMLDISIDGEKL